MKTIIPPPFDHSELAAQFEDHCVAAVKLMVRAKLGSVPDETLRRWDNVLAELLRAAPIEQPFTWDNRDTIPCDAPCEEGGLS